MPQGLDKLREMMEQGYGIADIDSTDDAIQVGLSSSESATLTVVVLDRQDAAAILRGEARWLEEVPSDFIR